MKYSKCLRNGRFNLKIRPFFLSSGNTQRNQKTKQNKGGGAESRKVFDPINDPNDQTSYFL